MRDFKIEMTSVVKSRLERALNFQGKQAGLDFAWSKKLDKQIILKNLKFKTEEISVPVNEKDIPTIKSLCKEISTSGNSSVLWESDSCGLPSPKILSKLATDAATGFGLDTKTVKVTANFNRLILQGPGSFYASQEPSDDASGIFAQLILQVPVVSGYEGGVLEVKCQHQSQHFDCSLHSKTQFYTTVLYSDCTYTFSPITAGHKVFLIFDLVWKNSSHLENFKHPVAIKVLKEVRESLAPWGAGQQDNDWDLLAIPTDHRYTPFQLSFDRLKGKDRLVAQALRSVQFLEIHLVSINNADRTVEIDQQNQIRSIGERDVPCLVLEDWTNVNNQRAGFPDLKVNIPFEVVGGVPESARSSFFVIWPKCQRMSIICRSGMDNALDFMETAISNGAIAQKFLPESLERVVNFCSKNPTTAWSRMASERSCRLLKICETMKAHQEAQNLIQLLSGGLDSGRFVGIPTEEVAVVWARVIKMIGWNSTEEHVLKMLVPGNLSQIGSFARLAVQFLDDGLTAASLAIANQMMNFLLDHLENMDIPAISSCLDFVMRLEQSNDTSDRQRLSSLAAKIGTLDVKVLDDFVSRINLAGTENPLTRAICRGISQQFDNRESISKFLREKSADFGTNHQPQPQRGVCKAASSQPMAKRIRTDN